MTTEKSVEALLTRLVRRDLGGKSVKLAPVEAGLPDRMVLLPGGRIFLIELKAPTGRLHPAQTLWHDRAAALGTDVVVLTGAPEVRRWVEEQRDLS